jgi:hypothetical protein
MVVVWARGRGDGGMVKQEGERWSDGWARGGAMKRRLSKRGAMKRRLGKLGSDEAAVGQEPRKGTNIWSISPYGVSPLVKISVMVMPKLHTSDLEDIILVWKSSGEVLQPRMHARMHIRMHIRMHV